MKQKLSISMDDETVIKINERLKERVFRNKSHLIEYAVEHFLNEAEDE